MHQWQSLRRAAERREAGAPAMSPAPPSRIDPAPEGPGTTATREVGAAGGDVLDRAHRLGHRVTRSMIDRPAARITPPALSPLPRSAVRRVTLDILGVDGEALDTELMVDLHNYLLRAVQNEDEAGIRALIEEVAVKDPAKVEEVQEIARNLELVHRNTALRLNPQPGVEERSTPVDPLAGAAKEDRTRLGFEIEPGIQIRVNPDLVERIEPLINETLASTEHLEFVLDDLNTKEALVQVEFRTVPLDPAALQRNLATIIKKEIKDFPLAAVASGEVAAIQVLQGKGWNAEPRLEQVLPALRGSLTGTSRVSPPAKLAQHVTHSIPLAGFLKLEAEARNLLIPRTGAARTIEDLLEILFTKIEAQMQGNTIRVTTKGRNTNAPNVKTALDTLAGLLEPEQAEALEARLGTRKPQQVDVAGETGRIGPIETFATLPSFPKFNPEGGRGFLAAEEKLKAPLFDLARRDVRVLVEHRSDPLVDAVNKALAGNTSPLEPYLAVFARLDGVQGDPIFERWFR